MISIAVYGHCQGNAHPAIKTRTIETLDVSADRAIIERS